MHIVRLRPNPAPWHILWTRCSRNQQTPSLKSFKKSLFLNKLDEKNKKINFFKEDVFLKNRRIELDNKNIYFFQK